MEFIPSKTATLKFTNGITFNGGINADADADAASIQAGARVLASVIGAAASETNIYNMTRTITQTPYIEEE